MTPRLALPFYFVTFATLSFGSHSISSAREQKNSSSSKQRECSHSSLLMERGVSN